MFLVVYLFNTLVLYGLGKILALWFLMLLCAIIVAYL